MTNMNIIEFLFKNQLTINMYIYVNVALFTLRAAKDGTATSKGYPESAYGMSKVGVTAATIVQQAEIDKDTSRTDIVINAVSSVGSTPASDP